MDNRWLQEDVERYSFLELAKKILPASEFPVLSYLGMKYYLIPGAEKLRESIRPQFYYVTKEEEKAILAGSWDSLYNYENETMKYGFYFPDAPIGQLNHLFPSWFRDPCVDELIRPFYVEDSGEVYFIKKYLTMAVFSILHEYGHYVDLKRFESKDQYALWIYDAKKPLRDYDSETKQLSESGKLTGEEFEVRNRQRRNIYRECADEKSADNYALSLLECKVNEAFQIITGE